MKLAGLVAWAALGIAGCSRSEPPPAPSEAPPPIVPVNELARDRDACKAYVAKVCDCAQTHPTAPALAEQCKLARALPDALETAVQVSVSADSARRDVVQTNSAVRHIAKECIEEVAKLPAAGCP